ncbi:MAG TPA: SDR family NAD(P)-dependent oxidoreductase [Steroidobacteraceae bacterium]|nr:SDR family NAD(P)-dependent oxidoreductase [Steroidobacteraceae bacterium]
MTNGKDAVRTVVISGAFGTLGAAVARRFAGGGARLGLLDRVPVPEAARREFAAPHVCVGGVDLANPGSAAAAMQTVAAATGGIDVLVNVAGGFRWEPLAGGDMGTWELMFTVNLKTAVAASQAALTHLLARGAGGSSLVSAGGGGPSSWC